MLAAGISWSVSGAHAKLLLCLWSVAAEAPDVGRDIACAFSAAELGLRILAPSVHLLGGEVMVDRALGLEADLAGKSGWELVEVEA